MASEVSCPKGHGLNHPYRKLNGSCGSQYRPCTPNSSKSPSGDQIWDDLQNN